jgi:hypothetical protein
MKGFVIGRNRLKKGFLGTSLEQRSQADEIQQHGKTINA